MVGDVDGEMDGVLLGDVDGAIDGVRLGLLDGAIGTVLVFLYYYVQAKGSRGVHISLYPNTHINIPPSCYKCSLPIHCNMFLCGIW